jgi:hypothetical protein
MNAMFSSSHGAIRVHLTFVYEIEVQSRVVGLLIQERQTDRQTDRDSLCKLTLLRFWLILGLTKQLQLTH